MMMMTTTMMMMMMMTIIDVEGDEGDENMMMMMMMMTVADVEKDTQEGTGNALISTSVLHLVIHALQ
jgi:hypothetical protein